MANSSSEFTDPSSSEQSCDTVIYVGSRDDDGTDLEHPPGKAHLKLKFRYQIKKVQFEHRQKKTKFEIFK